MSLGARRASHEMPTPQMDKYLLSLSRGQESLVTGGELPTVEYGFVKLCVATGVLSDCFRLWQQEVLRLERPDFPSSLPDYADDIGRFFEQQFEIREAIILRDCFVKQPLKYRLVDASCIAAELGRAYFADIAAYKQEQDAVAEKFRVQFPFLLEFDEGVFLAVFRRFSDAQARISLRDVARAGEEIDWSLAQQLQGLEDVAELPQDLLCGVLPRGQFAVFLQVAFRTRQPAQFTAAFLFFCLKIFWGLKPPAESVVLLMEQLSRLSAYGFRAIILQTAKEFGIFYKGAAGAQAAPESAEALVERSSRPGAGAGAGRPEKQAGHARIQRETEALMVLHVEVARQLAGLQEDVQLAIKELLEDPGNTERAAVASYHARRLRDLLQNSVPACPGFRVEALEELGLCYAQHASVRLWAKM